MEFVESKILFMPVLPDLPPAVAHAIVAALASVVAVAAGVGAWRVRGTTAVPAAAWAVAAAVNFAGIEAWAARGGLPEPSAAASARLVAVALSICPAMSLLGAKRPQHGVWQVIVASLAVVIAMPAASAAFVRPGALPDVHLLARGFLLVLAVAGWVNFLGTGRVAAATLLTLGLLLLSRPFLPGVDTAGSLAASWAEVIGAAAAAAGAVAAMLPSKCVAGKDSITKPFISLRDTIGSAWTLRIAERFNTTAETRGWPCRLLLDGLSAGGDPDDDAWRPQARRVFESLMRRFVSRDWLRRHGGDIAEATRG